MPWVALVGPELEENLSLRYLASSLQAAGYRSEIVPYAHEGDFGSALAAILTDDPPLAVGISLAFQWRAMDMLALAMALREAGYRGHVTLGGHFATFACKEILRDFPEVDTVVRQEGEETLVRLVQAVDQGLPLDAIAGLAVRRETSDVPRETNAEDDVVHLTGMPSIPDLAKLPWPDRRGEPAACFDHRIAPLVSSRGCYAHCTFCCIAAWHEQTLPGKRYRIRDVDDVAAEMVDLQKTRGIEVFVFHDDNFFVPGHRRNLERFHALADALERRGIGPFATVVKARPTDVDPEVFRVLVDRLHCIRCYVGIETDSEQGLETLRRWAQPRQNHRAIEIVRELGLYTCFNMLVFDPDTTVDTLRTNIGFMKFAADYPFNFGRVELYAGTPLLERMLAEGRARGDYVQWDYDLHDPDIQRVYELAIAAFRDRNFGADALANRIMGTRFDLEIVRHFHPDVFEPAWLDEGKALSRELGLDSAGRLEEIVDHVTSGRPTSADDALVHDLRRRLREKEADVDVRARDLAARLLDVVGRGRPLTEIGDRVATSLQRGIVEAAWGSK